MVTEADAAGRAAWQTGAMDTGFVTRQLRAINAELWRVSGPVPKLSRWAWAADAVLALLLTIASVDTAMDRAGYGEMTSRNARAAALARRRLGIATDTSKVGA